VSKGRLLPLLLLGRRPRRKRRLIPEFCEGLALEIAGIAIGLLAAVALTRLMQTLLYQGSASDPGALFGIAAAPVTVAFLASYIPARRATRVDPTAVLRSE
jgi:putative ABC transport system permease protein